ncbi:hypothetical protein PISL3812_00253 [Talaromyces islandicus]|uniref:C2H2-type domain-containing protein n=1 Tax=Talaromyces islandicus TaxID=28573 RepID=A0A0U1LKH1_TALIS|nr:hypothetical protein PISL3812_00253 [Talaromyces islandicus]
MDSGPIRRRGIDKTCDICGRSFARNEHLVRHRRVLSESQQLALSNAPTGPFPGSGTSFSTSNEMVLDEAAIRSQIWEDTGGMDGIWDLPPLDAETWLHDLNDDPPSYRTWTQNALLNEDSKQEVAIGIMIDHFQRRSRASSPTKHGSERLWYSSAPLLHIYDKAVINVLLNIARRHLASTFPLYAGFQANEDTSHELCLAMAAVGGLFASVDGSANVAKALYNDARRIHLEKFFRDSRPPSLETSLNSLKTFILLEIYGLCSGDKRSYEFVEAFHRSTIQAASNVWHSAYNLGQPLNRELSLVSEALDVIENYRVLLQQRPPCFPAMSHRREWQSTSTVSVGQLMTAVGQLTNCAGNLHELVSLGVYTWAAGPKGQEHSRGYQLWRSEYVQLGLERWREANARSTETTQPSSCLLYHLAHIHLQVNIGFLQRFAHIFTKMPDNPRTKKIVDRLQQCICGQPFKVSLWHARAMLCCLKEYISMPTRHRQEVAAAQHLLEPPHLPYCIYFATLLMWYNEYGSTGQHSLASDACIRNGAQLLGMLKVKVARVLANALCELSSEEEM